MPDGPVVLNNTPLVALWTIGRLDLLRDLFGEILIPQAVEAEFLAMTGACARGRWQMLSAGLLSWEEAGAKPFAAVSGR
jgi:predicted nucleic acid-binding protein